MKRPLLTLLAVTFILFAPISTSVAQDITPPTLTITSVEIEPAGQRDNFIFRLTASDDQSVSGLEYRARVNNNPFGSWVSYPYIAGYPLFFSVHCTSFGLEVRSVDTSGNYSSTARREFRKPFKTAAGTPITPGFVIDNPPAVLVSGATATVIAQKFAPTRASRRAMARAPFATTGNARKKKKGTITYEVTVTNQSTQEIRKITSKRNVIAAKNLSSGVYTATYKAKFTKRKTIVAETLESPEAYFSVGS